MRDTIMISNPQDKVAFALDRLKILNLIDNEYKNNKTLRKKIKEIEKHA